MTDGVKAGVKDESLAHLTRSESLSSSFLKYPTGETHILAYAFKIENSTRNLQYEEVVATSIPTLKSYRYSLIFRNR